MQRREACWPRKAFVPISLNLSLQKSNVCNRICVATPPLLERCLKRPSRPACQDGALGIPARQSIRSASAGSNRAGCICGPTLIELEHERETRTLQFAAVETMISAEQASLPLGAHARRFFPMKAARRAFPQIARRPTALAALKCSFFPLKPRPRVVPHRGRRSRQRISRSGSHPITFCTRRLSWRSRWVFNAKHGLNSRLSDRRLGGDPAIDAQ